MEVDGGAGCPSGVDSGLWMPFSRPRAAATGVAIDGTPCRGCGSAGAARWVVVASAGGEGDGGEGAGVGRGEG
jgi:hypothetical protein